VAAPARWKLLVALWTVYLVWGSTYLAIKVSVETLPPFLSTGGRFLLAGIVLATILLVTGRDIRVGARELGSSALVGIALLGLGVGVVALAETRIDSSVAAMIAGTVPLQIILLRTIFRERVARATQLSVLAGLAGLALVVVPGGDGASSTLGLLIMVGATVSWSLGSFFGQRLPVPTDSFVATTWEMLSAGTFLVVLGTAAGEISDVHAGAFTAHAVLAWLYLAFVGSLVAFSAYAWLLKNAPISTVVTHQYVNPVVAIALGAIFLGERLTVAMAIGAALIIGSVFVAVRQEGALRRATAASMEAPCGDGQRPGSKARRSSIVSAAAARLSGR
jgi:drug/metabolite transporter (DMT)-like permease